MRPKTMILFVIAVGCGLVASIGVSQYMETGVMSQAVETEQIFVAVTDVNIGEQLDAQNVKLEVWPTDRVPEGAVRDLEALEERYPRTRLYAGEPILQAKLMDSQDRGSYAVTIPKGYRVVSVKVTVEASVAGLVQPGDRVDLMVFLRKSSEVPETGTRTILRDVNVFSVDGETERSVDENGEARNVRTISLLVKPDQAETVMLASELGQLKLSLRRPDDQVEASGDGISIQSLLGSSPESANERNGSNRLPTGLVELMNEYPEPIAEIEPVVRPESVWKMQILSPTGMKEYRWSDVSEMPEEYVPGQTQGQADFTYQQHPTVTPPVRESLRFPVDTEAQSEDSDSTDEDDAA
jgi:pilus assembly protein CpaB